MVACNDPNDMIAERLLKPNIEEFDFIHIVSIANTDSNSYTITNALAYAHANCAKATNNSNAPMQILRYVMMIFFLTFMLLQMSTTM